MTRYIALLRGINVGKHKAVAMSDLRDLLGQLGYRGARTLLRSGNAVFDASVSEARVARDIEAALQDQVGVQADVVVRTREEMADVVAANPLPDAAADPARFLVTFFPKPPSVQLDAAAFQPEQFAVLGREVYLWCVNGINDSPLSKALSKISVENGTARNWNTVTKLLAMAAE